MKLDEECSLGAVRAAGAVTPPQSCWYKSNYRNVFVCDYVYCVCCECPPRLGPSGRLHMD